jgi:uncharacterized protein YabE (DUF348 family)
MSILTGHPFVVPVLTFLALFFASLAGFVASGGQVIGPSDSRVVRLSLDGEEQILPSRAKTVAELLAKRGIGVQASDIVEPALDSRITGDGFAVSVWRARPIELSDEGVKKLIISAQPNLAAVVEEAGITLKPEDRVERASLAADHPTRVIQNGPVAEKVVINRAVPVKLSVYGNVFDIRTHAVTVEELMRERGLAFTANSVFPAPDTPLRANDLVVVAEPGKAIALVEAAIPYNEQRINDSATAQGQRQIQRAGQVGRKAIIWSVNPDGTRRLLQELVLVNPVNSIVRVGTRPPTFIGTTNAELLLALRMCESRGNYQINTGNGFYGAYQFTIPTWHSMGTGYPRADLAPPPVQDDAALRLAQRSGFHSQFPGCSRKLGLPPFPF